MLPIEKSVPLCEKYPSVVERYFTHQNVMGEDGDPAVVLLFHSNKICLVTLAPNHKVLSSGSPIRKVNFKVGDKLDRSSNKVVGKGKKGGQHLMENSLLCIIECEDGTSYNILAGVKGKLVEVNENLISNPQLLVSHTETNGYIAVILQKLDRNKSDKSCEIKNDEES
jgi:hypothetical protein